MLDPGACQGGTVLVRGRCADPSAGIDLDLREGPEPNDAGIVGLEDSVALAGRIEPGSDGRAFVVRGPITPLRDADGNGELDQPGASAAERGSNTGGVAVAGTAVVLTPM